MEREIVDEKAQDYTYWDALIKKKFRHDQELSRLDSNGFIKQYTPFIYSRLGKYERIAEASGSFLSKEDLVLLGQQGILHAITKYEPKKGFKFLTYASHWIESYMQKGVENTADLSVYYERRLKEVDKAMGILKERGILSPTIEEISKETGLSLKSISGSLRDMTTKIHSLDQLKNGDDEKATIGDTLMGKDLSPSRHFMQYNDHNGIFAQVKKVARLSEKQNYVLKQHLVEGRSFRQISPDIKVSPGRVRQIYDRTIKTIRHVTYKDDEGRLQFKDLENRIY